MKLYLILGQRNNRYEGEHAPEALDVADEFTYDEDPWTWLNERLEHHRKDSSFASVQVLAVNVPDGAVDAALNPRTPECNAAVG